ncbi:hypothetical protein SASPL_118035 [Salvia splendens]|uniref:Uncharacterized protein n=1 Tax=Salvia splendens TaxID=180675 RepID=A0A8X8ZY36_SALSN|nr:hypothetical protein SASPL_118035 [Salvia splendens]
MFVKIVHPGGHVELHDRPILASEVLDRNPKCCIAHPTVFQQPHEVVSPETTLLLGRKYYVVPLGTIRKLRLRHRRRGAPDPPPISNGDRDRDCEAGSVCWLFRNVGKKDEVREKRESGVVSESLSDGNGNGGSPVTGRISLMSIDNWHPGLHSICEDY